MAAASRIISVFAGGLRRTGRGDGRFLLREATGALGDIGTFVPIVIGLVVFVGMDAATIFVFAGLMNIVSGLLFRIPVPVQPMKAIAALAIAGAMTGTQVSIAGMFVGLCMLFLVIFGLIRQLDRVIPRTVLRGIQLAVAIQLMLKGAALGLFNAPGGTLSHLWGGEGLIVLAIAVAVLVCSRGRWQWAGLGLVVLGVTVAVIEHPALLGTWHITFWRPGVISFDDKAIGGVWRGGIAQLPLTLLNSVLVVSLLAEKLFPNIKKKPAPTKFALSVGLMNLFTIPFGAMPVCHGSGGLSGQYCFGARTGLSMVMLGTVKLLVGLLFGAVALGWMHAFPVTVLGVFLILAGITLAQASKFWLRRTDLFVAPVTAGVYLATKNLVIGFAAGYAVYLLISRFIPSKTPVKSLVSVDLPARKDAS